MSEEGLRKTANSMIFIGNPIEFDEEKFEGQLERLISAAESEDEDIRKQIREIVPTYQPESPDA